MKQWYVLYTKPHCEERVVTILNRRGYNTYFPKIVPSRRNLAKFDCNSAHTSSTAFFPRYLFTEVDLDCVPISTLRWVPGLLYVLGHEGIPAPVPENVIKRINKKVEALNSCSGTEDLEQGDIVRISAGPLEDLLATFDRSLSSGERVQILLTLMGQRKRVRINRQDIEKVEQKSGCPNQRRPRRTRGKGRHIRSTHG